MTNFDAHLRFVTEHPDDNTAALALADHYEELHGTSRAMALRFVGATRRAVRHAREMEEATLIMSPDSPARPYVSTRLRSECDALGAIFATIMVVNGSRPPTLYPARRLPAFRSETGWILVGARAVILCAAQYGYCVVGGVVKLSDNPHLMSPDVLSSLANHLL